ncbi:SGNH/GDSL hydrolase family protein [Pelomyxa schiedti]|nr:SGNH/GDSL hydrolase family protein [Pelomyxa schiedti]
MLDWCERAVFVVVVVTLGMMLRNMWARERNRKKLVKRRPTERFHVVLLGDSVFDNKRYDKPDVVTTLRTAMPSHWTATLLAKDGDLINGVYNQLKGLPKDATHLVLSVGGNNALHVRNHLARSAKTVGEALGQLAEIKERFMEEYRDLIEKLQATGLPLIVSTVYNPFYSAKDPLMRLIPIKELAQEQIYANAALCILNDAVISVAQSQGLPVLDLQRTFNSPKDYANPIEPSRVGAAKIAQLIVNILHNHDFESHLTTLFKI